LPIPEALLELVRRGRWPVTAEAELAQNLSPIVPTEIIRAATNDEEGRLFLLSPQSFVRIASLERELASFWNLHAAPSAIDFARAVVIGDFGLGSDAPIVLDYAANRSSPRVKRLSWRRAENSWIEMAPDAAAFVTLLGL
jgi:hypothetical protein